MPTGASIRSVVLPVVSERRGTAPRSSRRVYLDMATPILKLICTEFGQQNRAKESASRSGARPLSILKSRKPLDFPAACRIIKGLSSIS